MIDSVIPFFGGWCLLDNSHLICSENHLICFCGFLLRGISEWTIVYFNSCEQLSEEYIGISIYRELFYNIGILFICALYLWLESYGSI